MSYHKCRGHKGDAFGADAPKLRNRVNGVLRQIMFKGYWCGADHALVMCRGRTPYPYDYWTWTLGEHTEELMEMFFLFIFITRVQDIPMARPLAEPLRLRTRPAMQVVMRDCIVLYCICRPYLILRG